MNVDIKIVCCPRGDWGDGVAEGGRMGKIRCSTGFVGAQSEWDEGAIDRMGMGKRVLEETRVVDRVSRVRRKTIGGISCAKMAAGLDMVLSLRLVI